MTARQKPNSAGRVATNTPPPPRSPRIQPPAPTHKTPGTKRFTKPDTSACLPRRVWGPWEGTDPRGHSQDELGRAGAALEGVGHLSNALRLFATSAQRDSLLPGLLSGRVRWCQGFSEPEAGSDLAGLKTRAELIDADGSPMFRVNGRKKWTVGAVADWCFLLCRTEIEAPKHAGISVLLVPMSTPGIHVRPIVNAARNRQYTEIDSTTWTYRRTICSASAGRAGPSPPNSSPTNAVPPTSTG